MKLKHNFKSPSLYKCITSTVAGSIIGFFILICVPGIVSKICDIDAVIEMKKYGWVLIFWGIELGVIQWFKKDKVAVHEFKDNILEMMPVAYALFKLFKWTIWGIVIAAIYNYWHYGFGYDDIIINNILFALCFLLSAIVVGVFEIIYVAFKEEEEEENKEGKD